MTRGVDLEVVVPGGEAPRVLAALHVEHGRRAAGGVEGSDPGPRGQGDARRRGHSAAHLARGRALALGDVGGDRRQITTHVEVADEGEDLARVQGVGPRGWAHRGVAGEVEEALGAEDGPGDPGDGQRHVRRALVADDAHRRVAVGDVLGGEAQVVVGALREHRGRGEAAPGGPVGVERDPPSRRGPPGRPWREHLGLLGVVADGGDDAHPVLAGVEDVVLGDLQAQVLLGVEPQLAHAAGEAPEDHRHVDEVVDRVVAGDRQHRGAAVLPVLEDTHVVDHHGPAEVEEERELAEGVAAGLAGGAHQVGVDDVAAVGRRADVPVLALDEDADAVVGEERSRRPWPGPPRRR